jgi:hypothetical protein
MNRTKEDEKRMGKNKKTRRYNPAMPSEHFDRMDLAALQHSPHVSGMASNPQYRFDGVEDASVFFARELDYVKTQTYDVEYPEFNATRLFPVESSVDPGVETITYYSYDKTGMAQIISDYSDDLPRADVLGKPFSAKIRGLGASYAYSVQDMRASRYQGNSLDVRRGESARRAVDVLINRIAWCGDEEHGLRGVLSAESQVPIWTPPTNVAGTSTKFADKTPDEILATFSGALKYMSETTKGVERPDTIVLDEANYIYLSTTPRSPVSDTTILGWLSTNLPGITFERAAELLPNTEYNPFGDQAVMILYHNDPRKLTIEIPLLFNQLPVQPKNMAFEIQCEARMAGAIIYYPLSLLIVPGV